MMQALTKIELHEKILASMSKEIKEYSSFDEVPFKTRLTTLGSLEFYAFTLTSPPGGRPTGEYKVQLMIPGQRRGERGNLQMASEAFAVIVGWSQDEDVFSLWDAYAHQSFAYSQNLQVKGSCVWLARVNGISTCERRLRKGRGTETVVACHADQFIEGIRSRIHFSAHRLNPESDS